MTMDIVPAMQGLRAQTTLDIKQEVPSGVILTGESLFIDLAALHTV